MTDDKDIPVPSDKGWSWVVLVASCVVALLIGGYLSSVGIFIVEWQEHFGGSSTKVGSIGVIIPSCFGVGGYVSGLISNRLTCQKIIISCCLMMGTAIGISSFSTQLWPLYLSNGIAGFGVGALSQIIWTVMSYNFNKWVALGNGIASAGIGLGTVVTPPLMQSISHFWNWQGALRTICAFCIVTAVCGALIRPSKKELYFVENRRRQTKESKQHPDSQMELGNQSTVTPITFKEKFIRRPLTYLKVKSGISLFWDYPRFLVVVIAYACIACGYNSSLVFFHSKLVQDDEIPKIQASALTSAIGVGGIVGRAISGAIIDCNVISRRSLYGVSSLFCSFFYYANPFVSLYPLLFVISVWFGLFSGIASCCPGYCARVCLPDEKLATGIGFIFLVEGVGTLLGVFFVGLIRDLTEDFTLSFVMCGTIFVVAAVIVFVDQVYFGLKDRKSQGQEKGDERNDKAETSGQAEGESAPTRNTDKDARENFAYEEDGDIEKYDTVRVHQEETQLSSENELVYTKESIL